MKLNRTFAAAILACLAAVAMSAPSRAQEPAAPKGGMLAPEQFVIPGGAQVQRPGAEQAQRPGADLKSSAGIDDPLFDPGGAGVHTAPQAPVAANAPNDFPTVARADYVFACMQVNGQTRDVLEKCSCSIDVIASLLPYAEYEEAETILSVRQRGGKSLGIFEYGPAKEKVKSMKRAQVEGELRCF